MKENAVELLKARKWKDFLMAVPLGRPRGYHVENANDLYTIRVRASQLSTSQDCDRSFSVTIDYETGVATITAKLKGNGDNGIDPLGSPGDKA